MSSVECLGKCYFVDVSDCCCAVRLIGDNGELLFSGDYCGVPVLVYLWSILYSSLFLAQWYTYTVSFCILNDR